jgi:hypothetical protein
MAENKEGNIKNTFLLNVVIFQRSVWTALKSASPNATKGTIAG